VTAEAGKLLDKAQRSLNAAARLNDDDSDFAMARTYYAMFYTAEALLVERGLRFRKHGAIHAALGEQFIKSGVLDAKFHRWLLDAFDKRIQADYGVDVTLTREDVRATIAQAVEFLTAVRQLLESGDAAP
jgi:uncharacterized protein (UPF0332 family)